MNKTAMILAAGRGERMRPLTDHYPKPLLKVHGQCLIEHHLYALSESGIKQIVINLAYKGSMIKQALGDGSRYGVSINYSDEGDAALESAGGIIKALPILGNDPFILVNADIRTDYPFHQLSLAKDKLASLVMVKNPAHHTAGDFALQDNGLLQPSGTQMLTYSGIGLYHPNLFQNLKPGKRPLKPVLLQAMKNHLLVGQYYQGQWHDIGTPERLAALNTQ